MLLEMTCLIVDTFPVHHYFVCLNYLQKYHKNNKQLHATFVFSLDTFFHFMSQVQWSRSLSHLIIS